MEIKNKSISIKNIEYILKLKLEKSMEMFIVIIELTNLLKKMLDI